MEFRILGPLEVAVDGSSVTLGSAKQRALLGVLLLHANKVVSAERLVDELWGARPPPTSGKLVQVYVSQLRRVLDAAGARDILRTRPPGYSVELAPEQLDATRFERLVAQARVEGEAERPAEALAHYDEALALWRGAVLADVAFEAQARNEAALLEELRLVAVSEQTDCALALGRHAELVGRLESLTHEHPLHERFWAQLMVALYRSGRQSEALGAYHQARRTLVEQVGLEPSPELHRLEKAILAHDPALELAARTRAQTVPARHGLAGDRAPPRRGSRIAVAAAAVLVVAAVAVLLLTGGDGEPFALASITPDSVVVLDPTRNELVDEIELHTRPTALAYGDDALWVGAGDDNTLLRIDPETHEVRTTGLGASPVQIAVTDHYVWVLTSEHTLLQLRSGSATLVRRIALPDRVAVGRFAGRRFHSPYPGCGGLAADDRAAWVGCWLPVALRVDAGTGAVEQFVAACAGGIALEPRALWCINATFSAEVRPRPVGELTRIDPVTRRVTARIEPPEVGPSAYAGGPVPDTDVLWVFSGDNLLKIDRALGRTTAVTSLRQEPRYIALGEDAVWTANVDATLSRVSRDSARLVRTIPIGPYPRASYPTQIAAGGGRIWVTVH